MGNSGPTTVTVTDPVTPLTGTSSLTGLRLAGKDGYWDILVKGDRIASISPSFEKGGGFVMPLLADIHTHLDKTFTASRMPERATSLFHAIEMMKADAVRWNENDIHDRAQQALWRAYQHGTALMRSHLDWHHVEPPPAWRVLRELANEWRNQLQLQLASLTPLDLFADIGEAIAKEVKAANAVLGAFIYRNDNLESKLSHVFDLAERYDLELDFHVDEGLDPDARGIDAIIAETGRRGINGRVLCGHGCALSVREPGEVDDLLGRAAELKIGLTVLPGCNSYLQDARTGRTPRLRGIAPLHEARSAGMKIMIGSDNVRDGFFPFGDYDLYDVFRSAALIGHLGAEDWLDAISETPANWMGRSLSLNEGSPANFIWLDAEDFTDALSRPRTRREVWRNGRVLDGRHQGEPK